MFGFESELLVVLIVALVVIGPKDLPRFLRMVGKWVGQARSMADQFKASFDEMARESELDELRKELAAIRSSNPLTHVTDELNRSILPPEPSPKTLLGEPEPETGPEPEPPVLAEAAGHDVHAQPEQALPESHSQPLPPGFNPAGP